MEYNVVFQTIEIIVLICFMLFTRIGLPQLYSNVSGNVKKSCTPKSYTNLVFVFALAMTVSCTKTPIDHNRISEISSALVGEWQLEKVEMIDPASTLNNKEDITEIMLGMNPSTLSINENTYLIAPGTSIHFIPQNGSWSLVYLNGTYLLDLSYGTLKNTIALINPEFPEQEDRLLYSFRKPPPECLQESDTVEDLEYLYHFSRIK